MNQNSVISERLLQYIWQFQRFDFQDLKTDSGEKLQVLNVGQFNTNAGPDFLEAKIQIGEILWAGNIEIHINSNDWLLHKHDSNLDYDNVILHIVWENNGEIKRNNDVNIPTLCLKSRVNPKLIADYESLINNSATIPCFSQFQQINSITKMLMLEKILVNRLERKAEIVLKMLGTNHGDWEETTYQLLAKTMGFGLNSIPFERLAQIIPLKILQKHSHSINSIEAALFGAAGFLENPHDEYSTSLKNEYKFIKAKYSIDHQIGKHEWKFMRLRPANFPTVRIAQFAQIIQNTKSLFSYFLMFEDVSILKKMFKTKPTTYWESRYNFGESSSEKQIGIGDGTIENILINAVVPILVAYSIAKNDSNYIEKSMNLLEKLKPEKNKITRFWDELEFSSKNAFDSQASIELFNKYCSKKACLSCNIGTALLK
jgi:Protein of unknown function (DUF2851)